MSDKSSFQKLMDRAEANAGRSKDVNARKHLERLFSNDKDAVEDVYIHTKAIEASDVLKGDLPKTVLSRALLDGIAAFRTVSPRAVWFIAENVPSAVSLSITLELSTDGALYIWSAEETTSEDVWRLKR